MTTVLINWLMKIATIVMFSSLFSVFRCQDLTIYMMIVLKRKLITTIKDESMNLILEILAR